MTPTITGALKHLNMEDLKVLSRHTGPCVTMSVPGYQPGAGAGTRHAHLRQLTQTAVEWLRELNRPGTGGVVAALEELVGALDRGHGGPAMTLFCAPSFTAAYETPSIHADAVTINDRFDLLPLMTAARTPSEFFILGLNRNRIRLYHYAHGRAEELALPAAVPPSLEAAGGFDQPEHTLESRSAGGPSVGAMHGVRFGVSGDHDSDAEYLRHFFGLVDRGLKETLNGEPLFLAGVQEELSLYRKTAKYRHIFESECHGNAEHMSADQVAKHAAAAAAREYRLTAGRAIQTLPEINHKIAGDAMAVFNAATEGRVRQIFVAEEARQIREGTTEDVINAAVVEGLRTGAEIFAYPGRELPDLGPVAAVLRY